MKVFAVVVVVLCIMNCIVNADYSGEIVESEGLNEEDFLEELTEERTTRAPNNFVLGLGLGAFPFGSAYDFKGENERIYDAEHMVEEGTDNTDNTDNINKIERDVECHR